MSEKNEIKLDNEVIGRIKNAQSVYCFYGKRSHDRNGNPSQDFRIILVDERGRIVDITCDAGIVLGLEYCLSKHAAVCREYSDAADFIAERLSKLVGEPISVKPFHY